MRVGEAGIGDGEAVGGLAVLVAVGEAGIGDEVVVALGGANVAVDVGGGIVLVGEDARLVEVGAALPITFPTSVTPTVW